MSWDEEAAAAAAREYGTRHYRRYAFRANLRRYAATAGALVLLALCGGSSWQVWDRWPEWIPAIVVGLIVVPLTAGAWLIIQRVRDSRW